MSCPGLGMKQECSPSLGEAQTREASGCPGDPPGLKVVRASISFVPATICPSAANGTGFLTVFLRCRQQITYHLMYYAVRLWARLSDHVSVALACHYDTYTWQYQDNGFHLVSFTLLAVWPVTSRTLSRRGSKVSSTAFVCQQSHQAIKLRWRRNVLLQGLGTSIYITRLLPTTNIAVSYKPFVTGKGDVYFQQCHLCAIGVYV